MTYVIAGLASTALDGLTDVAGGALSGMAGGIFGEFAKQVNEAMVSLVTDVGTMWIKTPTPDLSAGDGAVAFLRNHTLWYAAAATILGILIAGARMVWEQRGEPLHQLLRGCLRLTLAAGAGVALIQLLTVAGDEGAKWIINDATGGDYAEQLGKALSLTDATGVKPFLALVLAFIGLLVSLMQLMLMIARDGVLVVIAGVLLVLAGDAVSEKGQQRYERVVAWTVAFLLYKPVAALVYGAALVEMQSASTSASPTVSFLKGLTLMILALLALPALQRVIAPHVGPVAGSSHGAGMLAAAVPAGAAILGRGTPGGGAQGAAAMAGGPAGAAVAAGSAATSAARSGANQAVGSEDGSASSPSSGGSGGGRPSAGREAGASGAAGVQAEPARARDAGEAVGAPATARPPGGSRPSASPGVAPGGERAAGGAGSAPAGTNPYVAGGGTSAGGRAAPSSTDHGEFPGGAAGGPNGAAGGRGTHGGAA
jgi:type IV secretory pathway TrbL component